MRFSLFHHQKIKGTECLNCGHPLPHDENYCPYCGQENDDARPGIGKYFSTFLENFFSFDSKLYRSLRILITQPGKFTADYIAGKRQSYVNPFKLLLHISILFFLLNAFTGRWYKADDESSVVMTIHQPATDSIPHIDLQNLQKRLDSLKLEHTIVNKLSNRELKYLFDKPDSIGVQDFFTQNYSLFEIYEIQKFLLSNHISPKDSGLDFEAILKNSNKDDQVDFFMQIEKQYKSYRLKPEQILDSIGIRDQKAFLSRFTFTHRLLRTATDRDFARQLRKSILSKISISMFFFIPLYTLVFSLFFIKKKKNYMENLIWVFNVQSAFFLLLIAFILLRLILPETLILLVISAGFTIYMYRSIRFFYGDKPIVVIAKMPLIILTYWIFAGLGLSTITLLWLWWG